MLAEVVLKKGKEGGIKRKHPWVFSGAIYSASEELQEGQWVRVYSTNNQFLGTGYYSPGSIALRIAEFKNEEAEPQEILEKAIHSAYQLRQQPGILNHNNTNAYRLIFGEGDQIPGLIIDWYNGHCVVQIHTLGIFHMESIITASLKQLPGFQSAYVKTKTYLKGENEDGFKLGEAPEELTIQENGNSFIIDIEQGQKTGFFLDQRENRSLVGELSRGKTVLNTFCYTGGFSIYALSGDAKSVVSVDLSERAMEITDKNVGLLSVEKQEKHTSVTGDVFEYLQNNSVNQDIVILDPPAFSKRKNTSHKAVIGYKRLNALALKKMKTGSLLLTFSCSQNVNFELFYNTVRSAAIEAKREIRVLKRLIQPADHPVSLHHPEGEYLKGLLLEVSA